MTTISTIADFIGTTTDNITSIWGDQIEKLTMNSVKAGNGQKRKYTRSAYSIWKDEMRDDLEGKTRSQVKAIWDTQGDVSVYEIQSMLEKKTLRIGAKIEIKKTSLKKPINAFIFFSKTIRKQVKNDNPDMSHTDLMRKIGDMWRDDELDRSEYVRMAAEDSDRYKREKETMISVDEKDEEMGEVCLLYTSDAADD